MSARFGALALFGAAAALGFAFDAAARGMREHRDRGDYWTRVLFWFGTSMSVLLIGALWVREAGRYFAEESTRRFWLSGWHPYFDQLDWWTSSLGGVLPAFAAALLPLVVWVVLLAGFLQPRAPASGRWLAGSIGFRDDRRWVILFAVPLLLLCLLAAGYLGSPGNARYPGAVWGTLALSSLSLIGVGYSDRPRTLPQAPALRAAVALELEAWVSALRRAGVEPTQIGTWPKSGVSRKLHPSAGEVDRALEAMGARGVAPELAEALIGLFEAADSGRAWGPARLVYAPDDCGQVEVTALAARWTDGRRHALTLVVAEDPRRVQQRLSAWHSAVRKAAVIDESGEIPPDVGTFIVDPQILSDVFLPKLKDPKLADRIGLVVWWQLESFTGVLGANLWAISRRLYRVLRSGRRSDVRTLVWVRSGYAQAPRFVERVLPLEIKPTHQASAQVPSARPVHIYRLAVKEENAEEAVGPLDHVLLRAARASAAADWPTNMQRSRDLNVLELNTFLGKTVGEKRLEDALVPHAAQAHAVLREADESTALVLSQVLSQGGRLSPFDLDHYVGLARPRNPYVDFLLERIAQGKPVAQPGEARHLICADGQAGVVRRHVQLALSEKPETRGELLANFRVQTHVVDETLERIHAEGLLRRQTVRKLSDRGQLVVEPQYSILMPGGFQRRPLDTVGTDLVDVICRDKVRGEELCLRVDPERLCIQAYPGRVFMWREERYKISDWHGDPAEQRQIFCVKHDSFEATWRLHRTSARILRSSGRGVSIGGRETVITRRRVQLHYTEELLGSIVAPLDPRTGAFRPRSERGEILWKRRIHDQSIHQSFATVGLLVRLTRGEGVYSALASLCQALRHVIPVHFGVGEDDLEVVPVYGETIEGVLTHGFIIVDLYPDGIGLIEAIEEEGDLVLMLMRVARNWLAEHGCPGEAGCPRCFDTPAAAAAGDGVPLDRLAALRLLDDVLRGSGGAR